MSALRVERDGPVLRIVLARPERRNAFDAALIGELTEAFADVGDARAVVLSGDGPSFSAGADVEWMRSSVELTYEENVADALRLRAMLDAIDGSPAPVVARVQGHALGGGCGLVACCDIAVAEPAAQFAFSEVKLGIVPGGHLTVRAREDRPERRAPLLRHGRAVRCARRRCGSGSSTRSTPSSTRRSRASSPSSLSAGPAAARAAKELARRPAAAEETARRIAEHRTSAEGQEGLRAFLDKRPPNWRA